MTESRARFTIAVEKVAEELPDVLRVVEQGRIVEITRDGKGFAEIRPSNGGGGPIPPHAALAGKQLDEDAFAPAADEEWPQDCR